MTTPYPEFPPNYKEVPVVDGLFRECLVIELRSRNRLSSAQVASIKEQLEATLSRFIKGMPELENVQVVDQSRFDPILTNGLRLKQKDGSQ